MSINLISIKKEPDEVEIGTNLNENWHIPESLLKSDFTVEEIKQEIKHEPAAEFELQIVDTNENTIEQQYQQDNQNCNTAKSFSINNFELDYISKSDSEIVEVLILETDDDDDNIEFEHSETETEMKLKRSSLKYETNQIKINTKRIFKLEEQKPKNNEIVTWQSLPWYCVRCTDNFDNSEELLEHSLNTHYISDTDVLLFYCRICFSNYLSYCVFLNHIRFAHHENLKLCCDVCDDIFENYTQLMNHRFVHNEVRDTIHPIIHLCSKCCRSYTNEDQLQNHFTLSHKYRCNFCSQSFIGKTARDKHEHAIHLIKTTNAVKYNEEVEVNIEEKMKQTENEQHNKSVYPLNVEDEIPKKILKKVVEKRIPKENISSCQTANICKKHMERIEEPVFENDDNFLTLDKKLECHKCTKICRNDAEFQSHLKRHVGKLPYVCKICSRCFPIFHQLKVHLDTHNEAFPYKCTQCIRRYSLRANLQIHMQSHVAFYICEICSKGYYSMENLSQHMKGHVQATICKCKFCPKSYKKKKSGKRKF